ncbi:hypothetical protein ACM01_05090 [Streptomyces viridochromogenes]|uniref:Uncharacterized protein n=1 Tax=Streptomyces viridochromogenes TaxID=1938 RepID=A0A0J7ZKY2_STRVR|nr:hypothetical protein [Streptomyces viridochromogenes]KMS76554.1 hypothetical protein ACM01_05090 [Streptomyces viridochromogenes]KOG23332.1 hypothetical protein ADK35_13750 [Streptomyces viridochromogenes]KOG27062.1 hypothetical protein ADK36_00315 [Streptomyces viridochromogenes]
MRVVTRIKAAAVATAAAAVAVSTAPAQAHDAAVDVSHGGCKYYGHSNHRYAETYKASGSCAGHAWLRVRINGVISSWAHAPGRIDVYAPSGMSIQVSDHKSCADCSYKNIWHI